MIPHRRREVPFAYSGPWEALAALSPDVVPFSVALFLLGLGWNLCYVGGSTLLSDQLSPSERSRMQGANDFLISLSAGAVSLGGGLLFASTSYTSASFQTFNEAYWQRVDYLVNQDERFAHRLKHRLEAVLHGFAPGLWTINLVGEWANSLHVAAREGTTTRLRHLTLNPRSQEADELPCVCLLLERGSLRTFLPGGDET